MQFDDKPGEPQQKRPARPIDDAQKYEGGSPKRLQNRAEETLQNTSTAFVIVMLGIILMLALVLVLVWALVF